MAKKSHPELEQSECAYNALVLPHLDYCCEVWDTIGTTLSDRLQKLQNRAARAIVGRKNGHGQSEPEKVGQLLAKHHGKFARVFSFMRGLL